MKQHEALTTKNYLLALDTFPLELYGSDAVLAQLAHDLEQETALLNRELQIDLLFTALKFYNLGRIRGTQSERSRRRNQAMKKTNVKLFPEKQNGGQAMKTDTLQILLQIAQQNGLLVKQKPLESCLGCIYNRRIALSNELEPAQAAQVLAHELAHFFLHYGKGDISDFREDLENEADAVAFFLLLGI